MLHVAQSNLNNYWPKESIITALGFSAGAEAFEKPLIDWGCGPGGSWPCAALADGSEQKGRGVSGPWLGVLRAQKIYLREKRSPVLLWDHR